MANIQNDILNKVLFFYELQPIIIVHPGSTPLRVRISTDSSGDILDDTYYSDFSDLITIDIRDIVAAELSLSIPEIGKDIQQTSLFAVFHIEIGDDEISGDFTVNGFSSAASGKMTDIDTLRVPEDYMIPLSLYNNSESFDIILHFPDGSVVSDGEIIASASGVGATSRMFCITDSHAAGKKKFQVELSGENSKLYSPVFEVVSGKFEQYLFANRYGGFDNIPMDGALEFVPDMSFASGSYSDRNEKVSADSEYIYSQNSGYLSGKVIELASELLCSSQIYHLDPNGNFRRIVIIDSDLRNKSNDSLHSFTFRYKYAEDTRPMSLNGKTAITYVVGTGSGFVETKVYPITSSPMVIEHGKGTRPCVTVVDTSNNEVGVLVEYIDLNSVKVSWNGQFAGYVYVN